MFKFCIVRRSKRLHTDGSSTDTVDYEHINKPEQIGSPDDGQVPGVHVGL